MLGSCSGEGGLGDAVDEHSEKCLEGGGQDGTMSEMPGGEGVASEGVAGWGGLAG